MAQRKVTHRYILFFVNLQQKTCIQMFPMLEVLR